ncbi:MAG: TetR/AcrR family transcriptional regulator [Candidatus Aminicenantes bacterium]|nr:TetR/AcrR family transcriptional regulator [Candidatus Aminicenantes bacterium]
MKTKRVSKVYAANPVRRGTWEDSARLRIVAAARGLFMTRGFIRVTADDLSAELGISKATLYREFRSKEEILREVVREFMTEIIGRVDALIKDDTMGFVERLVALFTFVGGRLSQFGPLFIRDIQKSAPRVWKEIDDFRRDKIITNFKVILAAGHRQGLFRGDIDMDLLLRMFLKLVEEFVNPAEIVRSGRSPAETFESVIKVFFQGILTDSGRKDISARTPALFEPRKEGVS